MPDQPAKPVKFGTQNRNLDVWRRRQRLKTLVKVLFHLLTPRLLSIHALSFPLSTSGRPPEGPARAREGRDAPQHLQQQGTVQGKLKRFFLSFSFRSFVREPPARALRFFSPFSLDPLVPTSPLTSCFFLFSPSRSFSFSSPKTGQGQVRRAHRRAQGHGRDHAHHHRDRGQDPLLGGAVVRRDPPR